MLFFDTTRVFLVAEELVPSSRVNNFGESESTKYFVVFMNGKFTKNNSGCLRKSPTSLATVEL